jgi:dTMP kinase
VVSAKRLPVFITFEGIEAAGKSTLISSLGDELRSAGVDVLTTREPGGTSLGDVVRRIFVDPASAIEPLTEALLLNASRAQLVAEVISPAMRLGRTILCDRFSDATIAYQGYGRGLDIEMLLELSMIATSRIAPDLTFLVDIPAELSRERVQARGGADRVEREGVEFHERVRVGYRALAHRFPHRIVTLDGTAAPADVVARARAAIDGRRKAPLP